MPVMVTGAEDGLGAAVVRRLLATGGEVRTFLDATEFGQQRARALRAQGCKVALGELDDEGHLEAALAQVHTVAHCHGGPLHDPDAQLTAAATLASAALGAGVRRLVWVRELAGDPTNVYLGALADIGALFDDLPIETVTLATAVRYGPTDVLTSRLTGGWLSGAGAALDAAHAPVHVDDVARAVTVADQQRDAATDVHLWLGLVGPDTMTLREFLHRLGAPDPDAAPPARDRPPPWIPAWLSQPAVAPGTGHPDMTIARGAERLAVPATS
jgi:uncharacterized protein YbjT (DUF2867 family)